MKITRRVARRIDTIVAVRKAERAASTPTINYDALFSFIPTSQNV
jgi:hypothetical protein